MLYDLISDELTENKEDDIVRTIADSYIAKGLEKGIIQGFAQGVEQGVTQTAMLMLKENVDMNFITRVTGLSKNQISKLTNKL